jgi:molybdopterin synthase sulfur carrier subunit
MSTLFEQTGGTVPDAPQTPVSVTLRFFAAARAAVGRDEQRVDVPAGDRPPHRAGAVSPPRRAA